MFGIKKYKVKLLQTICQFLIPSIAFQSYITRKIIFGPSLVLAKCGLWESNCQWSRFLVSGYTGKNVCSWEGRQSGSSWLISAEPFSRASGLRLACVERYLSEFFYKSAWEFAISCFKFGYPDQIIIWCICFTHNSQRPWQWRTVVICDVH